MAPDNREEQLTRREADKKLDQIHRGMKALLSIFDIDIESSPEVFHKATVEANKDTRFLRTVRTNTTDTAKQARNLTIGGFFAGLGMLIVNYFNRHH